MKQKVLIHNDLSSTYIIVTTSYTIINNSFTGISNTDMNTCTTMQVLSALNFQTFHANANSY